jgi:hypothetical protein
MNRHRAPLLVSGLVIVLAMGSIARMGDLGLHAGSMLVLWGLAFLAYLVAVVWALGPGTATRSLPIILGLGLLARVLLIPTAPTLSEDLYRYLWDGHLVAHGVNPFPHAPSDPALSRYRNGLLQRLNHADVPTIYPPAAQLLFAATAAVSETPVAWKLMLLALETLLVLSLLRLLARRGLPPERLLLYYWNPLVLVESFGSGHVDLAAAAFLLLALWLHEKRHSARAGVTFALAVLTKLTPALLVPHFLRRRAWTLLAAAAVTAVVLYAPFLSAGSKLGTGLGTYARHWEFNGALYQLLRHAIASDLTVRRILAAILFLVTLDIGWRARSATQAALGCSIALLLLNPTLFPWYLVPIVALLPLHPDWGMIVFSGVVALSYLPLPAYRETGVWVLPAWIVGTEYGALLATWGAVLAARLGVHQGKDAHVEKSEEVQHEER